MPTNIQKDFNYKYIHAEDMPDQDLISNFQVIAVEELANSRKLLFLCIKLYLERMISCVVGLCIRKYLVLIQLVNFPPDLVGLSDEKCCVVLILVPLEL